MTLNIRFFTPAERRVIQRTRTPCQVQRFLKNYFQYNREENGETLCSFRRALHRRRVHCLEAVFIAAAILEHHGYPPRVLDLSSIDHLDHVVFLYRKNGRYGTIGFSRDKGLWGRPPKYRTIKQLVMSYYVPFIDKTGRINRYATANLDDIPNVDWRFSKHNVWKVQQYLIDIPHKWLRTSLKRYRRLHAKYLSKPSQYVP
jgi:hypothetical protein